ncbi:MAG TPA: pilus assembly PilX N-terminal domain-containing protein [Candidatus Acidoferrum sp.]|nr:pilus assembly PilX N-terminal domain-containing protein [Candidatus Acidoferrum sp.]
MKKDRKTHRSSEDGIALLIAIFVLLLISVVAIALLVSSGTETALGVNYRTSSTVYYAAIAGLEEARGRLLPKNPNYFGASYISPTTTFPLGQTIYVINRGSGDNIVPWDSSNTYYDNEYQTEFGTAASSASWQSVNSVWDNNIQGIPGPMFKWVRINAATEQSLFLQVNASGSYNNSTPIFYDPAHINTSGNPWPSLIVNMSPPSSAVQALEITALAALPNGTQKILQYLVAPVSVNLTFPAALILDGYSDVFNSPDHSAWVVQGSSDGGDGACAPSGPVPYPVHAVGVPDNPDVGNVMSGIPSSPNESVNFTGTGSTPSIARVTLATSLQTVQGLNQIAQTIIQNADAVIAGPATEADLPSAMSSANPMTVAVQGDFSLGTSIPAGYGLLLVTGNFTYASGSNWNGIVLVIGKGTMTTSENGAGGTFNGATLIAQTLDSSGNLLPGPHPGPATFNDTLSGSVGRGFVYNCGWIQRAQAPLTYKILSFHEIRQ